MNSPVTVIQDWKFGFSEDDPQCVWQPVHFEGRKAFNREIRSQTELAAWIAVMLKDSTLQRHADGDYVSKGRQIIANTWALLRHLVYRDHIADAPARPQGEAFRKREVLDHLDRLHNWCVTSHKSQPTAGPISYEECATYEEAMAALEFSDTSRISQLVAEGQLQSVAFGRNKMIEPRSLYKLKSRRELEANRSEERRKH